MKASLAVVVLLLAGCSDSKPVEKHSQNETDPVKILEYRVSSLEYESKKQRMKGLAERMGKETGLEVSFREGTEYSKACIAWSNPAGKKLYAFCGDGEITEHEL